MLMTTGIAVPARLHRLPDLAYNLWWSWHDRAKALFRGLDPVLWEATDLNPVVFLRQIAPERLARAANDPHVLQAYDAVVAAFDATLNTAEADTWIAHHQPLLAGAPVAYFSAEFGLIPSLPIYSGGLGVLAGDHMKEASDLGLPLLGVSLLYRQ